MSYLTRIENQEFSGFPGEAGTIAITGHVRPDGDCVGSCLGLCTYLADQDPQRKIDIYLDPIPEEFTFLKHADSIRQEVEESPEYDLCIALDCSDPERMSLPGEIFRRARHTLCIDHHITNEGFGEYAVVCPESSSTCELLYYLLKKKKLFGEGEISFDCAQALYTGIVHDTGEFRHTNTTLETMTAAGELIGYGINTEKIINDTIYKKTYAQNQLLGKALLESILLLDKQMIFSVLTRKDFQYYGCSEADTEGIIDQLRVTDGIHVAMLLYETEQGDFKVSLRSDESVDVSVIAREFGGGGHVRAAGCTQTGEVRDIVMNIASRVESQLEENEKLPDMDRLLKEQGGIE